MERKKKVFWVIVILLTILRIGLMLKLPFYAIGNAKSDDFLLLDYAEKLASGQWLGTYGRLTLVKGISYPVFIVLCKYLLMPYSLGLVLFYIIAAIVFCIAIKNVVNKKEILGLCYLFLVYSPTGFSLRLAQKIYRMAIIYPAVLLVVACLIGVYLRKDAPIKKQLVWIIGSGISFSFFGFIREDSIWLAPFFFGALLITAIYYLFIVKINLKEKITRTSLLVIPICILILTSTTIKLINYKYYRVYTTNDRIDTSFADLVGNMLKIDTSKIEQVDNLNDNVWVSRETLVKIINECPTLQSIEDTVLYYYDEWAKGTEGQLPGDIYAWALRDAVSAAGYYDTAVHANKFYEQVNKELEEGFATGVFEKKNAIYFSSQSTGIQLEDIPYYVKKTFDNFCYLANYYFSSAEIIKYADGVDGDTRFMETITGVQTMYRTRYVYNLSGYLFAKNDNDIL